MFSRLFCCRGLLGERGTVFDVCAYLSPVCPEKAASKIRLP